MSSSPTGRRKGKARKVDPASAVELRRRANMQAVRGRDTGPELAVRAVAHRMGLRYRLHCSDLPGRPDLVFPKWKTVIFVNGCFWHQHGGCRKATIPKSNSAFWDSKLKRNVQRDQEVQAKLAMLGWSSVTIWECEIKDLVVVRQILRQSFPAHAKAAGTNVNLKRRR
jgi:DNA mismatch endonuclease, patch repair protein